MQVQSEEAAMCEEPPRDERERVYAAMATLAEAWLGVLAAAIDTQRPTAQQLAALLVTSLPAPEAAQQAAVVSEWLQGLASMALQHARLVALATLAQYRTACEAGTDQAPEPARAPHPLDN